MDTTISSAGTFIAGSYIGGGSTYNLGLLQQQMMVFQSGLAVFVAGAIFYGGGEAGVARSQANADGVAVPRRWTDVQEDETEEERDERVSRARRRELLTLTAILVLVAIAALLAWWSSSPSSDQYMNVDENMTTTDMNALDQNLATESDAN